jgi:hypothetical protein
MDASMEESRMSDAGCKVWTRRVVLGALLAAAAGSGACSSAPSSIAAAPQRPTASGPVVELAGQYAGGFGNEPLELRIQRDGRMSWTVRAGTDGTIEGGGTAELRSGRVALRWSEPKLPETFAGFPVGADGALVRPDRWIPGDDSFSKADGRWKAIRTQLAQVAGPEAESFVVVPWETWTWLVPVSSGEDFCRAVNAGEEPVQPGMSRDAWLVRARGAPSALPRGLPKVPAAWNAWLLPAPVEGRLLGDAGNGTWWAELNDATGVRCGMLLRAPATAEGWKAVVPGTPGGMPCGFGTDVRRDRRGHFTEFASEPWSGTVAGRVEQIDGNRVRLRWSRDHIELQAGTIVSSLARANGATLGIDLVDPLQPRLDLTQAPMLPGTESQCFKWQALLLHAFLGSGDAESGAATPAQREAARAALAALDPVELLPACQRVLSGQDFTNERQMKAMAALLAWWDERQHHVYALGFDTDDLRQTPLACVQRLAAVARWAAWWEQTAADPQAVAHYRDAVSAAARG